MSPRVRKAIGATLMIVWVLLYIAVAGVVGDRVMYEKNWIWKLLYFPIVGIAWILPLKPLLKWMHAKDRPSESPDV
jgi:hypothetical protein